MAYTSEISRSNPAAFLFLLDQSGSMTDNAGMAGYTKAQFLCDALNRVIVNLIARSSKSEGVRDYFHLGAIGYGGAGVGNALSGKLSQSIFHPISAFEAAPLRVEDRIQKIPDGAGGMITQGIKFPVWLEPQAKGGTPMRKAIRMAAETVAAWCDEHPRSYPPTILHVTDGDPTDGDPEPMAEGLRQIGTDDGDLLLFNLHVGGGHARPIRFPLRESEITDPYGQMLFRMSSDLPDPIAHAARERGYDVDAGAKGFFYNVEPIEIVEFFDIGTRASSQSMLLR
ncbi:MAG: hypothetical protein RLY30_819 [Pseudomonadota bacterium]